MEQTWRTVRVFISSTFKDMQAERDWLVRMVFPELKERCAARHLYLLDVDLRWGVTEEEAKQGKVLDIILSEIDRSRPFFIAILGERYGSISTKVPEDTEYTYPWLKDYPKHSLTALEIVHGVLRNPDLAKRSFFYFRDPQFVSQVPENKRGDFTIESPEAALRMVALKDKIRNSDRPVMENYPARWDDMQGRVVDLDIFGQRVLEDLWTAICTQYPEEAPIVDSLTIERQMHESFAEERSRLHVGRIAEASRLTQYVQGTVRHPVVITGESGCGKSAFLASWYRKYVADYKDDFVLAYFIGASPESTQYLRLLRNMCEELKRRFDLKEEIPEDDKKLSETLSVLLVAAARDKARIVLVVDALDQLSTLETAHGLGWLLDYIPEKVRLVVSSLEGDCLDVLRRHAAEEMPLPPLVENEQRQIIQNMLDEWRRKLDARQMTALLAHSGVKNPLYLHVALEELKLFGMYGEELTTRIKTLADSIPGLFDQVLERLEKDHGRWLVSEIFTLLVCSRYGLSELEMLELLRREGEEQFPRVLLLRLDRSAGAYLVQRGPLLNFFHRQLADAVAVRYPEHQKTHGKLAAYFQSAPLERKIDEYPFQLEHALRWKVLSEALVDLDFFDYAIEHGREYEWMSYWRALKGRLEPGERYLVSIEARIKQEGETDGVTRLLDNIGNFLADMALYEPALPFLQHALAIREKVLGSNHPYVARNLNNWAELYYEQGKYEEALPLYQRALTIYEKALGPDHPDVAVCLNNTASLYNAQGKYEEALPLYQRALAICEKTLGPNHPGVAMCLNNMAGLYRDQGKYEEALPLLRRTLTICEKALGLDHPHVATSLNNLAELYRTQGKNEEALPLLQRSLAIREKTLGPDHPDVATGLINLAGLYRDQGKYEEALPFYQRALAILEKVTGTNPLDVARSINGLAELYREQGKYEEALPLLQRALAIREKFLGLDHPDVAMSLNNLAGLYLEQGKYKEALPLYQRVLAIREKTLGPNHPDVATSLNNIASLYNTQGKYEEALPLYQRAFVIREKALGPNHPNVARSINGLAGIYHNQGKYEEALPLYERALAISEKVLGPNHPYVATCLNNLAGLYYEQGKYEEALPLFHRTLSIREKVLGPDHPDVAMGLNNLATLYVDQTKNEEALPLYQRALAIREKSLSPDHPYIATCLNNLAGLYYKQGKYAEALPLYQRALAIYEKALGPDHPDVAVCLNNIASLYSAQGKYEEALPLYQRALLITEKSLGPDHSGVATCLNNLAGLYYKQGKYEEALPLLRRTLAILEKSLGPNHPNVATSLNNIASLYYAQGKYEEALPLYHRALAIRKSTETRTS